MIKSRIFFAIFIIILSFSKCSSKVISLEGVILQVSSLPIPEKSDYPDCNYTAMFQVDNILSQDSSIPEKIILVIPGFRKRILLTDSIYTSGQRLKVKIELFDDIPETLRQIQQTDRINSLDFDYYYLWEGQRTDQRSKIVQLPVNNKNKLLSPSSRAINLPVTEQDEKAVQLRKQAIREDLDHINSLLVKNGGDFRKWYDSLSTLRREYDEKIKNKESKWVGDSYFTASAYDGQWGHATNYVEAIIQLNQFLKKKGIDLIVLRVPYKGEICSDLFVPEMKEKDYVLNPYLLKLNKDLLEANVEVIDMLPPAISDRFNYPLMYWYQNDDLHPSNGMAWTIASILSERLKRYGFTRGYNFCLAKQIAASYNVNRNITYPKGNPNFNSRCTTLIDCVLYDSSSSRLQLSEENDSPCLIIGDSFIDRPAGHLGAGIPHYLAYKTGVIPNWVLRAGGANMMGKTMALKKEDFFKNRKVCIFIFSPATLDNSMETIHRASLIKVLSGEELRNSIKQNNKPEGTYDWVLYYGGVTTKIYKNAVIKPIIKIPSKISGKDIFVKIKTTGHWYDLIAKVEYGSASKVMGSKGNKEMYVSFPVINENKTISINLKMDWLLRKGVGIPVDSIEVWGVI